MMHFLKGYRLGYRQAVLKRNTPLLEGHENIVMDGDLYRFSTDGKILDLPPQLLEWFDTLHDGDIISINEHGLCSRIYDNTEKDVTIFLGGNCNSNCVMCPSSDYERQMDYSGIGQTTGELIEMLPEDIHHYAVTGGEPTLQFELFLRTMARLAQRFPKAEAQLLTNGRSFSSGKFLDQFLAVYPPRFLVGVPLHGSEASIHDAVTRAEGSYDQTIRGIRNLCARNVSVEIRIVVSKMNQDDLLKIAEFLTMRFPELTQVTFISLEVRGNCVKNRELVYIDPESSFQHSRSAINHLLRNGIRVELYNFPLCCVDRGYWMICRRSISSYKVRYEKECGTCDVHDKCGGIFESTIKTAKPLVHPVHLGER